MADTQDFFSTDYAAARARFVTAAAAQGARLDALTLEQIGPDGGTLSIDIAILGSVAPRVVILHSSGLHGVEGFAGSAIQIRLLREPPALAADCALVLVHALNPFGMAWLRRANENNVDLNRNVMLPGQPWSGAPADYRRLNETLLNPRSPPYNDLFLIRALLTIARYGFRALKQAVVNGQYEFPEGLFFGGQRLEPGPRLYLAWLVHYLSEIEHVVALDVHTGLGKWGREYLFHATSEDAPAPADILAAALQQRVIRPGEASVGYNNRGGLGARVASLLPRARVDFLTQEFGTYPALRILRALRDENRWHHYGSGGVGHATQDRLKEVFCPASPVWRKALLATGIYRVQRAASFLRV